VNSLATLGSMARAARHLGLGRVFALTRDSADAALFRLGWPPLKAQAEGIEIRGFLRHRSFLAHLGGGDYERLSRKVFIEGLEDADLVADVGAHIGFYTLLAARGAPQARVLAFEPDPYNAAALRVNIKRAGAHAVEVMESAASDDVGRAGFQQSLGTIGGSLVRRTGTGPTQDIQVATTTLDAALGDTSDSHLLLKLDVEGAERTALRGARESLSRASAVLAIVELNPIALEQGGSTQEELLGDLEALGLDVQYLDERSQAVVPVDGRLEKGNLVARRAWSGQ
jgi:FkbM family methyltransferase